MIKTKNIFIFKLLKKILHFHYSGSMDLSTALVPHYTGRLHSRPAFIDCLMRPQLQPSKKSQFVYANCGFTLSLRLHVVQHRIFPRKEDFGFLLFFIHYTRLATVLSGTHMLVKVSHLLRARCGILPHTGSCQCCLGSV